MQLTKDHRSLDPLWGPNGQIVFVKQLGAKQAQVRAEERALPDERTRRKGQAPHPHQSRAAALGPVPTAWSANGKRLLAEFGGQDTSYAVAVNPRTGAQRPLDNGSGEQGFVGTALSGDGKTVLGFTGGFEPGPNHHVASVPYGGGKAEDAGQKRLRTRLEPLRRRCRAPSSRYAG